MKTSSAALLALGIAIGGTGIASAAHTVSSPTKRNLVYVDQAGIYTGSGTALCPDGTKILSGGFETDWPGGATYSKPTDDHKGWTAQINQGFPYGFGLKVYAICTF